MQWAAFATAALASLSLLAWVILRCRSGFDFTDEGFYLNSISSPWKYHSSASQFGFVYHPLYKLVGGDVILLRQVNVLIVFGLAWALCFRLFRAILNQRSWIENPQTFHGAGIALVMAAGSLAFLDFWLPTPSYNSLTFQSLMLAAIGVLFTGRELSWSSLAGWILIGIGGGFAFLAKPTSAAMLACVVAIYLAAAGKFRLRGLSISVAAAVFFLAGAALLIDGSLAGFIRRIVDGSEMGNRLLAANGVVHVFRLGGVTVRGGDQKYVFICLLIIAFAAATLSFLANEFAQLAAASIAIVMLALVIATITGHPFLKIYSDQFQPAQFAAVALGIAVAGVMFLIRAHLPVSRESLALIALFVGLPCAYAFGTGTNYLTTAARVGLFLFLAGFVVCAAVAGAKLALRQLLPVAAIALVIPAEVLSSAMEHPYRQTQPLHTQMVAVEVPRGKSRLFLSEDTANYIQTLQEISAANGFRAGDPVLDLTGARPGSLFAMGARPLGVAWTLGGYPGSTDFLAAALDGESCEAIAASWILTEPTAPDRFSVEMLRQFGIDVLADYAAVGSISGTRSFSPQKFEHRLLKPVRSAETARLACEKARRAKEEPPG
jgi:hypothetical protein